MIETTKIEAKVHLLPTENYPAIGRSTTNWGDGVFKLYGWLDCAIRTPHNLHHLYFTADEKIKGGDWVYSPVSKQVRQVVKVLLHKRGSMLCYQGEDVILSDEEKIIATTDPKLEKTVKMTTRFMEKTINHPNRTKRLPKIAQSFIEEYCEAGGIDKVLVECIKSCSAISDYIQNRSIDHAVYIEPKTDDNNCIIIHPVVNTEGKLKFKCWSESQECWVDKALIDLDGNIDVFAKYHPVKLFLRDDVHPVEEKMIPRSQVTDLMVKFSNDLSNWKLPEGPVANWLNKWIKENLPS